MFADRFARCIDRLLLTGLTTTVFASSCASVGTVTEQQALKKDLNRQQPVYIVAASGQHADATKTLVADLGSRLKADGDFDAQEVAEPPQKGAVLHLAVQKIFNQKQLGIETGALIVQASCKITEDGATIANVDVSGNSEGGSDLRVNGYRLQKGTRLSRALAAVSRAVASYVDR